MRAQLKHLTTGVVVYGVGDVAVQAINFLLLPLYLRYLSPHDYGALLILTSVEALLKLVNRWGLDGAFMRYFLDRDEGAPRATFASTIMAFLAVVDGVLLVVGLAGSSWLAERLFDGSTAYVTALRLMLLNSFLLAFTFLPFHVMRLGNQPRAYSALTFARSAGQVVLRLIFIIHFGLGVTGVYVTDLLLTLLLLPFLWRWVRPLARLSFSLSELKVALRFALPRLPSGLAQQGFDAGNKLLFSRFAPLGTLGVYNNGFTLGTAVKFFIAAFETAWAPFYYQTVRRPDAPRTLAKMTTYSAAVLVLLCAGTAAIARDLVQLMLTPQYQAAIPIVPIIAVGLAFQGLYLLTSIGLNVTSRTEFYPVTTIVAATVGLGSGLVLMPRLGAVGAAWAFLLSFVTQAGIGFVLARRFYPIPYEWGRLSRVVGAGVVAAIVPIWLVGDVRPLAGVLARGSLTVLVYSALLWSTGFLRASERAFLREMRSRVRRRSPSSPLAPDGE